VCNLIRYKAELQEAYGVFPEFSDVRIEPKIRFKVAPSESAPVITMEGDKPRIQMMHFGFKTAKGRQLMARGETVSELPMFKEAFRVRRCLIIAHGFYDSLDMGAFRQPWHFHLKGDGMMCFAGLWRSLHTANDFTILSAPANKLVLRVIDRMPVILESENWHEWLNPDASEPALKAMLRPDEADKMESWPVTRNVNKRGFDGPECVEPVVPDQSELGLF
jgi:putative SOS response-associated peptidase YedK